MENLMKYAELVKKLGGAFIQIYEPKAVGHYAGKDVKLKQEQMDVLREFYMKLNFDTKFKDYPIVAYTNMVFRTIGCAATENRFIYVDTNGEVNLCPFCRSKSRPFLDGNLDDILLGVKQFGCAEYEPQEDVFGDM
jgi:MoaA/NifB/PqqE/SkfB family radical SAM enzyme